MVSSPETSNTHLACFNSHDSSLGTQPPNTTVAFLTLISIKSFSEKNLIRNLQACILYFKRFFGLKLVILPIEFTSSNLSYPSRA